MIPTAGAGNSNIEAGQFDSGHEEPIAELGSDSGRHKFADDFSVLADAPLVEDKNVLHGDDVAFHSGDLGDVRDFARAVAQPADLDHHVNRRGNLPAANGVGNIQIGHRNHRFQAAQARRAESWRESW